MKTKTKFKVGLLLLLLNTFIVGGLFAQDIPLVYNVENTGIGCSAPVLPIFSELPIILPLTDPFEWSDGSGRDTSFESWACRRAEIKAEIENYEVGPKPERPDSITASYADDLLTVNVTVNGNTLTLTSQIILPEGEGPFPAIIGIGGGTGSLPSDIFSSRDIAQVSFNYWEVMAHTQSRGSEPINLLYPDLSYMGAYSAWPWGVSRLIDGLELVADVLPIDLKHMAITGCSFAGKMALFSGAFDERIALTIVQESGGGGAAAWRVSETLTGVETLGNTSSAWFLRDMFKFSSKNVSKLPHDHHELMAMVAPRALFIIGNPSQVWLAEESGYVSSRAAHEVWKTLGISDRFGFSFNADHGHCALPDIQVPEVEAFVDRFLLGDTLINTDITIHEYTAVDYSRWYEWWGTGVAEFPSRDRFGDESIWLEAECAYVGDNWEILNYPVASNGSVVSVRKGLTNANEPSDSASAIYFPFTVTKDTTYFFFTRLICPSKGDSYWVKLDDGPFKKYSGLTTVGLQWKEVFNEDLTIGDHTLTIAYTEEGAKLDKICISNLKFLPSFEGEEAENLCEPRVGVDLLNTIDGYSLSQNYPNPVNERTNISFEIPNETYVSLKVFNILGEEVAELAGGKYAQGKHTVEFNSAKLTKGVYFYTIKADSFVASQKMVLQRK